MKKKNKNLIIIYSSIIVSIIILSILSIIIYNNYFKKTPYTEYSPPSSERSTDTNMLKTGYDSVTGYNYDLDRYECRISPYRETTSGQSCEGMMPLYVANIKQQVKSILDTDNFYPAGTMEEVKKQEIKSSLDIINNNIYSIQSCMQQNEYCWKGNKPYISTLSIASSYARNNLNIKGFSSKLVAASATDLEEIKNSYIPSLGLMACHCLRSECNNMQIVPELKDMCYFT